MSHERSLSLTIVTLILCFVHNVFFIKSMQPAKTRKQPVGRMALRVVCITSYSDSMVTFVCSGWSKESI